MINLTQKILEFWLSKEWGEVIPKARKLTNIQYYIHKNMETFFGKETFSTFEFVLKNSTKNTLSFFYGGEKYIFFMKENHLILRKGFYEIVFCITLNEHSIHNFIQYQEDAKMIQEFYETNFEDENYVYHKIDSTSNCTSPQEKHSITLKASFESVVLNSMQDKFRVSYVHLGECKKSNLEKYWDRVRKKDIFLVSSVGEIERLEEIFEHLKEYCSKEYARIKLK